MVCSWDTYIDQLTESLRKHQSLIKIWKLYTDQMKQMREWLETCQQKLQSCNLKNTAGEKKSTLLDMKNLSKEALMMQKCLYSIEENSKLLSTHVNAEIKDVQQLHASCSMEAKSQIDTWQQYLNMHTTYNEEYNTCLAWLKTKQELLQICNEHSNDKQSTLNKHKKMQVRFSSCFRFFLY